MSQETSAQRHDAAKLPADEELVLKVTPLAADTNSNGAITHRPESST